MKPVRVKLHGLIPMTRRTYLIALVVAGLFAVLMVGGAAAFGRLPPLATLWNPPPPPQQPVPWFWLYANLYRILVLCLIAQVLDTFVMLRAFGRKEAEEREAGGE